MKIFFRIIILCSLSGTAFATANNPTCKAKLMKQGENCKPADSRAYSNYLPLFRVLPEVAGPLNRRSNIYLENVELISRTNDSWKKEVTRFTYIAVAPGIDSMLFPDLRVVVEDEYVLAADSESESRLISIEEIKP